MAAYWYALRAKPHKERVVYERLLDQGTPVFFPSIHVKPVNPRSARIRPYFPGYLFVQADLSREGENAFRWLPGAHGLVRYGDIPAVVPDPLITELKTRLQQIEAGGGLVLSQIKPGDRVRVTAGPFAGYEAIFDAYLPGRDRVQVLLAFLSRQPQRVKLDPGQIEK